eukprot:gene19643-35682_t
MGLSKGQLESLRALADTFCPSCEETSAAKAWRGDEPLDAVLWKTSAGDLPILIAKLEEAIDKVLDSGERLEIGLLLSALSTVVGSALLIPTGPFTIAFTRRSSVDRELGLAALSTSILPPRRKAFNALKRLILGLAASHTDPDAEHAGNGAGGGGGDVAAAAGAGEGAEGMNPFWKAAGYPGPPRRRTPQDGSQSAVKAGAEADEAALAGSKLCADFESQTLKITKDTELEYDVVIVGSGYSVLVLEKGRYFAPQDVTQLEEDAISNMYEKSGLLTSDDGSMAILAGATFGGGTSVNWACCLPPPDFVRKEWSEKHGLKQFVTSEYDEALAAVNERIGASTEGAGAATPSRADQLRARIAASRSQNTNAAPAAGGGGGQEEGRGTATLAPKTDAGSIKAMLAARRQERAIEEAVRFSGALFRPLARVETDVDWKNPSKTDNPVVQILPDTDPLQQHPDQHDFRANPTIEGKDWQRVAESDAATDEIAPDTDPLQSHPDHHQFRSEPNIADISEDWQRVGKSYNSKEEMALDAEPSEGSSALANPRTFDTLQGDLDWKHLTGKGGSITDQIAVDATPSEGNTALTYSREYYALHSNHPDWEHGQLLGTATDQIEIDGTPSAGIPNSEYEPRTFDTMDASMDWKSGSGSATAKSFTIDNSASNGSTSMRNFREFNTFPSHVDWKAGTSAEHAAQATIKIAVDATPSSGSSELYTPRDDDGGDTWQRPAKSDRPIDQMTAETEVVERAGERKFDVLPSHLDFKASCSGGTAQIGADGTPSDLRGGQQHAREYDSLPADADFKMGGKGGTDQMAADTEVVERAGD